MHNVKSRTGFDLESDAGKALLSQAIELFKRHPFPSISAVERELRPGYAIAAQLMAELERRGIVSAPYGNGQREYFGEGADGIAAFRVFAEKLRAGVEPAAHWWRNLTPSTQREYLPGGDGQQWGDIAPADQVKLRARHWRNMDNLRKLERQFSFLKMGVVA